jgi:hypothetical protein
MTRGLCNAIVRAYVACSECSADQLDLHCYAKKSRIILAAVLDTGPELDSAHVRHAGPGSFWAGGSGIVPDPLPGVARGVVMSQNTSRIREAQERATLERFALERFALDIVEEAPWKQVKVGGVK